MSLLEFNQKNIVLTDTDGKQYSGIANFIDKYDLEDVEDAIQIKVGNFWEIFYQSDIKTIELV
ncbi:hypothetical protein [Streptococcus orisratti]|uniref:hypothetical protein n=1 Tax=Streptococcus orisratti TaxID=114652 RepID=UPI002942FF3D|nr:hypothetical protein [Streptococcus orisratti]